MWNIIDDNTGDVIDRFWLNLELDEGYGRAAGTAREPGVSTQKYTWDEVKAIRKRNQQ